MPIVARIDQYANLLTTTEFDEITTSTIRVDSSGIFYANEFSENLESTFVSTNTFAPYDLLTADFASVPYGVGTGTYMRHTNSGVCIVYNEIDEVTNLV